MGNHIFGITFKVVKKVENAKFYSKFRTITSWTECKWAQPVLATYRSFQSIFNLFSIYFDTVIQGYLSYWLFWWPWKRPIGVPRRQVSGRASSGSLSSSCGQKVLHPQPPIACLVGRREMLLLLQHVVHPHDFRSLLVQFHLERWDDLVKLSVFFLEHSHPSFCVLVLVLRGEEWIASSHLFS